MRNILTVLALLVGSTASAVGPQINGSQINPQTGISVSSLTATGSNGLTTTKITASGGSTIGGQETVVSTLTVQGASFSVSGSTLVVTGGNVGIGVNNPASNLNVLGNAAIGYLGSTKAPTNGLAVNGETTIGELYAALEATIASTVTVKGNAFSVGGSTFVVSGGNVGIGTASPLTPLETVGSSTQAIFSGWSPVSGASHFNGALQVGDTLAVAGMLSVDSTVNNNVYLDSTFNGTSEIDFRLKTQGTATTPLAVTSGGSVKLPNGTTGAVLCLTSGNLIGHCTSAASCTGTCTCTCTAN